MSEWTINPKTLLFEKLSCSQAEDLENLAYEGQVYGQVFWDHSAVVAWFAAANMNENQKLMSYTTVFLARAALSSSRYFRNCI